MNTLDRISLVLHVLAAAGLVAGGVLQVFTGRRLRVAATAPDIARWAAFARSAGPLLIGSAAVSFVTGSHLAGSVWTNDDVSGFSYPFITLGAAALILLAPVGPMVGGRRLQRLAEAATTSTDVGSLREAATSSRLWGPVYSLVGVAIGLIWVMSAKPGGWLLTGSILVGTFALGWLTGTVDPGRRGDVT